MKQLDERTMANLDVVLERACRRLSTSGVHQSRKFVATRLLQAARRGATTLGALEPVAHQALDELKRRSDPKGDAAWSGQPRALRQPGCRSVTHTGA